MRVLLILLIGISLPFSAEAQWINLNKSWDQVQMYGDGSGVSASNVSVGYTPSSGVRHHVRTTTDDWLSFTEIARAGGGLVCCPVTVIDFKNDTTGIITIREMWDYKYQMITKKNRWKSFAQNSYITTRYIALKDTTTAYILGDRFTAWVNDTLYFCKLSDTALEIRHVWKIIPYSRQHLFYINDNQIFIISQTIKSTYSIYKSTDGGYNWVTTNIDSVYQLNALSFPTNSIGYCCGNNGLIYKTTNGGDDWYPINSPTSKNIYGISFLNDSVGLICGADGLIFYTQDEGDTWQAQNSNTTEDIRKIKFIDQNTAYCWLKPGTNYELLKNSNVNPTSSPEVTLIYQYSKDYVQILLSDNSFIDKVEIFDTSGKCIHSGTSSRIYLFPFRPGLYLVRSYSGGKVYSSKFVKI